ncbi:hypothetical protein J2R78_008306 [Bradyrhizobium sp. USDA 4538]|nr:hypothetical protein [Bradyrhizobium sp. USDA 4538]MCP1905903.1 hypothetical protein [Bradyrhizobium sp. USDA 4537]
MPRSAPLSSLSRFARECWTGTNEQHEGE